MKPIQKDELYKHFTRFLKSKGVELTDGSYARGFQQTCGAITDAVNLSQKGLDRAKVEIGKGLDKMRQAIHEKTAPKKAAAPPVIKSRKKASKTKAKARA